ncbi:unnamed protein product [Pleuronectes platessa]|uniref:Uncharacterized protein n=1 Tax=Pleuronectes platessa TaxID=8262 RepID=A0A9N7UW45_PLEPL|nr:unnamed protein product [Pleuronectes platessa]
MSDYSRSRADALLLFAEAAGALARSCLDPHRSSNPVCRPAWIRAGSELPRIENKPARNYLVDKDGSKDKGRSAHVNVQHRWESPVCPRRAEGWRSVDRSVPETRRSTVSPTGNESGSLFDVWRGGGVTTHQGNKERNFSTDTKMFN